jgi:hypothetical protein
VVDRDEQRLNHQLDRLGRVLPRWLYRILRGLRAPGAMWLRIPIGLILVFGGLLSFLPVLGIWMLPLGLLLLAQDLPFLRHPVRRALILAERRWLRFKRRR